MKKKFYVVFVGRKAGVYLTWAECHSQVSGYPNNLHNSYGSYHEAEQALADYQRINN